MNTALYIRVSTEGQRTDSQDQELKGYCRQRGWKALSLYVDKIGGAKASKPDSACALARPGANSRTCRSEC